MRISFLMAVLFSVLHCESCTPPPTPVPPPPVVEIPDAGPDPDNGSPVSKACINLDALDCIEGHAGCVATVQHILDTKFESLDLACMQGAHSKSDARKCPHVECP